MKIPRILTIAGSDSGGGAGIQADIKTITMLGGHALTAITAITAQNTLGVAAVMHVPAEMVIVQIDAVVSDIGVDAIKIGMIGSARVAEAVARRLLRADLETVPVILDPVMIASSGATLADGEAVAAMGALLGRATVATPNLDELAALSNMPVGDAIAIENAAGHLVEVRGARAVLVTGVPRADGKMADHLYYAEDGWRWRDWSDVRIDTDQDHGTGCTLSSAIAVGLGQGLTLPQAIEQARAYVRATLAAAPGLGVGHGPMGHGLARAHFPTPSP